MEITKLILQEAYSRIKDNDVILYPMGDNGVIIKNFLNNILNIQEYAIVDEQLSKYISNILSIDELKQMPNYNRCIFLITSNEGVFSHYLIEQGVSRTNIINPWINHDELIMDCFIYLIDNDNYKKVLDYQGFLYNYGQFTKSFYSALEDKFYVFDNKQFSTTFSTNKFPGFKNLYSYCEEFDVCIVVIRKYMDKRQMESIITEQLLQKRPLICIAEDNMDYYFNTSDKNYRFSCLYIYQWEMKE